MTPHLTQQQKDKMLECLNCKNFCSDLACSNCPLNKEYLCAKTRLSNQIMDLPTQPEKPKFCDKCGQELKE